VGRSLRLALLTLLVGGVYFVWLPEQANALAELVGIGRGADLITYLWIVITLAVMFLLYLKILNLGHMVTKLARHIALANPRRPNTETPVTPP
jgi:hypothetical protein